MTPTKPMHTPDEHREEAERLFQLPPDVREAIIAWHREIAANPNVRKADRDLARERADALEWHLRRLFWKR